MKKNRKKNFFSSHQESFEVSLTPLIDTVLVLLIVFILASPTLESMLKISLPVTSSSSIIKKNNNDYFCFAINQHGYIFLKNKVRVSNEELIKEINEISKKKRNDKTLSILIFADKDLLLDKIIEIMTIVLHKTSIKEIYVKTKKISF